MTDYHLGSFRSIDAFVEDKLRSFDRQGHSFETMFSLMFREEPNVLYERSEGFRIYKTTYGEAKAAILRKSALLRQALHELPQNAVVGLYMDNSLEWIEAFWAILLAGFRPLLMNLRLPEPLLKQAMDESSCAAVVSDGRIFDCPTVLPEELEDADPSNPAVVTDARIGRNNNEQTSFGTELLVMSSGTSEHVKVCAYTAEEFYYQIVDSYAIIRRCAQVKKHCDGELKLLTFLPFYHVFGLIAMYLWFGFFSRTFVHLNDFSPQTILNTIRRHRVTHIFAVPLFWEKVYRQALAGIHKRGEATETKFQKAMALQSKLPEPLARSFSRIAFRELRDNIFGDSIRFLITGGSFIDPKVLAFFNGIGYRLANGYGMTEIGITSVELSAKRRWLCGGCVGSPMTHAEYRVDESGELLVRGNVLARYILDGEGRHEREGWFHTHDLAVCEQGHYRLLGRQDDLLIGPDGENRNPNLLEPELRTDDAPVCLIGAKKDGADQTVLLVSVPPFSSAEQLTQREAALKERIAALGLQGAIGRIAFVGGPLLQADEFKPNRLRLARDYAAGRLPLLDPATRKDEDVSDALAAQVRACFAEALGKPAEEISEDEDFFTDLGGTSLDYFGLLARLEEEFGRPFPPEDMQLRTVRGVTDFIRNS